MTQEFVDRKWSSIPPSQDRASELVIHLLTHPVYRRYRPRDAGPITAARRRRH